MSSAFLQVSPRWRFLFALLLLTGIAAYAFTRTEQIQGRLDGFITATNSKTSLLIDMRVAAMQHIKDLAGLTKAGKYQDLRTEGNTIKTQAGAYFELEAKLGKILATSQYTHKEELAILHTISEKATAAAPTIGRIQQLAEANQSEEVAKLATAELSRGPVKSWLDSINQMIAYESDLIAVASGQASNEYEYLRTQILLMAAGVILLALVAAWFTFTRIGNEPQSA